MRLQGDERGSIKKGKKLEACGGLVRANREMQSGAAVRLGRSQKEVVRAAIVDCALKAGERLLAIAVQSNHVHVVVGSGGKDVGRIASRLKNAGYFSLRGQGFEGKLWARGYNTKFCFDEGSLRGRIGYVEGHGE